MDRIWRMLRSSAYETPRLLNDAASHFGLGHGNGAHAPDEYYVIESSNPKVQGIDGAVKSYVEYLFEVARTR